MIFINQFFEAVDAYMLVKKEQIHMDEDVRKACADVSQIIVTYLEQHNIKMKELEKNHLVEEIYSGILGSLDVIIVHSYKTGFAEGLIVQEILKEMK